MKMIKNLINYFNDEKSKDLFIFLFLIFLVYYIRFANEAYMTGIEIGKALAIPKPLGSLVSAPVSLP